MKKILAVLLIIFSATQQKAQQSTPFRERTFLHWTGGLYVTKSGGVLMTNDGLKATTLNVSQISVNKFGSKDDKILCCDDSIIYKRVDTIDASTNRNYAGHHTTAPKWLKRKLGFKEKFYGDIRQDKNLLYFYPWLFKTGGVINPATAPNPLLLANTFVIEIPVRTVVSVSYRSLHYGVLTLPIKIYLASNISLKNNYSFEENINFFIGRKWGTKSYYYLPNEEEGHSFTRTGSINFCAGIGKVELDNANSSPNIDEKRVLPSISTGLAFGLHYEKVGFYLTVGCDSPLGPSAKRWNFAYMPWVGLGIGLGIE